MSLRLTEAEILLQVVGKRARSMATSTADIVADARAIESAVLRKVADFAASKCSNVDAIGPCCLNRFADTARTAAEEP